MISSCGVFDLSQELNVLNADSRRFRTACSPWIDALLNMTGTPQQCARHLAADISSNNAFNPQFNSAARAMTVMDATTALLRAHSLVAVEILFSSLFPGFTRHAWPRLSGVSFQVPANEFLVRRLFLEDTIDN